MNEKTEQVYQAMMHRLLHIEIANGWEHPWTTAIEEYGLGYEVAMSSGLTVELCRDLNDETFLGLVNVGMEEWDI